MTHGAPVGATQGTRAKALTGKVPKPSIFGGTTVTREPDSGSSSSEVRCSTIGILAARTSEWTGRSLPDSTSSILTESIPTRVTPWLTRYAAPSLVRKGAPAPYSGVPNRRLQPVSSNTALPRSFRPTSASAEIPRTNTSLKWNISAACSMSMPRSSPARSVPPSYR